MTITSSGSAGTRGEAGTPRVEEPTPTPAATASVSVWGKTPGFAVDREGAPPPDQSGLPKLRSVIRSTATSSHSNTLRAGVFPARNEFLGLPKRLRSGTFRLVDGLARWTEWDTRAFARGAAIAALTLALVAVVTAASDEGGLAWGVRAGRTLPLAPVCSAVGAWLALAPARARGDDRALAALGRSPWGREGAAVAGGAVIALVASIAIAGIARVNVSGFYPRAEESIHWTYNGGGFTSDDGRWRIGPDGVPSVKPASIAGIAAEGIPRLGRVSAAIATAALGLALPMLIARARSRRAAAIALGAIGAGALATILAFQAAAAALASALVALLPPLLLLAWAASRYRAGAWSRAKYPR